MKNKLCSWARMFVRLILGGIFLYSGLIKLRDPQGFADSVFSFLILPKLLISPVALVLPILEILIGGFLLINLRCKETLFSVIILCLVFAFALTQGLIRGLSVDCGCFGSSAPSSLKTWTSLARDIFMLLAAVWVYMSLVSRENNMRFERRTL